VRQGCSSPPHRILAREERARRRLVEEEDGPATIVVRFGRQPPAHETHAERFEVPRRDDEPIGTRTSPGDGHTALDVESPVPRLHGQGQSGRGSGHADAGDHADLLEHLGVEGGDLGALPIARGGRGGAEGEDAGGLEAGGSALQPREALHEQARAGEEDDGDRDLGRDQRAAQAASHRRASRLAQHLVEGDARDLGRGEQAEDDPRAQGDADREGQDGPAQRGFLRARKAGRIEGEHRLHREPGHGQPGRAAHEAQHAGLGQKLAHQAEAIGAQGGAHGQLTPARFPAREQQAGEVRAGQEEDERHRPQENDEHGARGPQKVRPQRHQADAEVPLLVLVGVLLDETADDDPHLRARGVHGRDRRKARHRLEVVPTAPVARGRAVQRKRDQHLRRSAAPEVGGEEQPGRSDAHDLERLAVDLDGASEHGGIRVEAPDPQAMREDRHVSAPFALLLGEEAAPRAGATPRTGSRFVVTAAAAMRSGSPAAPRFTGQKAEAAICKARLRSW